MTYDFFPDGDIAKNIEVYEFAWFAGDIGYAGWEPHSFSTGDQPKIEHKRFHDSLNFHDGNEGVFLTMKFLPPNRRTTRGAENKVKLTIEIAGREVDNLDKNPRWKAIKPILRDNGIPVYIDGEPAFAEMYDTEEDMKVN
jgi:hypothetical protein